MRQRITSKFDELPSEKTAWWAMGLGAATVAIFPLLGIFASVIRPIIDDATSQNTGAVIGFSSGVLGLTLSISALVTASHALKHGERSWILWLGLIPAIFIGFFWILMIIAEFIFPH